MEKIPGIDSCVVCDGDTNGGALVKIRLPKNIAEQIRFTSGLENGIKGHLECYLKKRILVGYDKSDINCKYCKHYDCGWVSHDEHNDDCTLMGVRIRYSHCEGGETRLSDNFYGCNLFKLTDSPQLHYDDYKKELKELTQKKDKIERKLEPLVADTYRKLLRLLQAKKLIIIVNRNLK